MSINITATVTQNIQVSDPREVHWHIGDTLHFPVGLGEAEFVCVDKYTIMNDEFFVFMSTSAWALCKFEEVTDYMKFFNRAFPTGIKYKTSCMRLPTLYELTSYGFTPFMHDTGEIYGCWLKSGEVYNEGTTSNECAIAGFCPVIEIKTNK